MSVSRKMGEKINTVHKMLHKETRSRLGTLILNCPGTQLLKWMLWGKGKSPSLLGIKKHVALEKRNTCFVSLGKGSADPVSLL